MSRDIVKQLISINNRVIDYFYSKERYSRQEVNRIIDSFPEPKDLFERSFFQYRCQCLRYRGVGYRIYLAIQNISAYPCLLALLLARSQASGGDERVNADLAVFLGASSSADRIPDSLQSRYEIELTSDSNLYIGTSERDILFELIRRYTLHPLFIFKNAMKLAMYGGIIHKYNPGAIIVTGEDSYTSSFLTYYCHKKGIKHINIMHGEMIYGLARTFFSFDRSYIWDEFYIGLGKALRANPEQFIVELPSTLVYRNSYEEEDKVTYYLQKQSAEQMQILRNAFTSLDIPWKVRPHPIWTKKDLVQSVFEPNEIEDPNNVSIEESLTTSRYVVAFNSTVLFQAYVNNKIVLLDDLSNPTGFQELKNLDFIMTGKERCLSLSTFLRIKSEHAAIARSN